MCSFNHWSSKQVLWLKDEKHSIHRPQGRICSNRLDHLDLFGVYKLYPRIGVREHLHESHGLGGFLLDVPLNKNH